MADGSSPAPKRNARLEARTTRDVREQIERAAALQGRSVSDFIVSATLEAAQRAITSSELVQLSREASIVFARALIDPPPPNAALARAFARRRELIGD